MRQRVLVTLGGAFLALAVATPAMASLVTVTNNGSCHNVLVKGQQVLPNDLCYTGPPL